MIDMISNNEDILKVVFYNKHLLGFDSNDRNILDLIEFHSQFSDIEIIKKFY